MKTFVMFASCCALALPAAAIAAPVKLTSTLSGALETAGGDADGTGSFTATVDPEAGDFCYSLSGTGIGTPTMAHVHTGAAGKDGPPVITIAVAEDRCMAVDPDILKPIVASPGDYYVNIHDATYPKGAIRGQLAVADAAMTHSDMSKPDMTKSEMAKPEMAKPGMAEPEMTKPEMATPETVEPEAK